VDFDLALLKVVERSVGLICGGMRGRSTLGLSSFSESYDRSVLLEASLSY
jgi:hypothetical protein